MAYCIQFDSGVVKSGLHYSSYVACDPESCHIDPHVNPELDT